MARAPCFTTHVRNKPCLVRRLPRQHIHQIGIMHRRERMMPHARVRKQHLPHEEMPHVNRPAVFRKCRTRNGERSTKLIEKRIRHRPDIARIGRVEGRAVFEIDLPRAMLFQPAAGGKRLGDGVTSPEWCVT